MGAAESSEAPVPLKQTHEDQMNALFCEMFGELQTSGHNVTDTMHDSINMIEDNSWVPDKASEYSYCMVFPPMVDVEDAEQRYAYFQATCQKVQKFGLELYCYQGRDKNIYVLMRCPLEVIRKYADDINFKMMLDPFKLEGVAAAGNEEKKIKPFKIRHDPNECQYYPTEVIYARYSMDVDENLYYRDPTHGLKDPFSNSIRARLVATMLYARPSFRDEPDKFPEAMKFEKRIAEGDLLAYYPLHLPNDLAKLQDVWLNWRVLPWNQPFQSIKNYMGEKVGLYFLFMAHYTRWLIIPAIIGLCFQFASWSYPTLEEGTNAPFLPFFSVIICVWGIIMLEYWKRLESKAALEWGCAGFEAHQEDRPEFQGEAQKSLVTGAEGELYYPPDKRDATICASNSAVMTMIGMVIGIVASIYLMRVYLVYGWGNSAGPGLSAQDASSIASVLNAILIQTTNFLYQKAAVSLTYAENYRTQTEQEDALTNKVFAFQFINSYASFFYLAFFAKQMEADGCGPKGCMYALGYNLAIIFVTQLITGQILQLAVPYGEIVAKKETEKAKCEEEGISDPETRPEHEFKLMPYDESDILGDYTSTAIQYGYLALFVTALPLAAPLALICNISEVKSDAIKMCYLHQRPLPVMVEDIGAFQGIYTLITLAAVISNSALMKFTMTVMDDVNNDTQWWIFIGFQWVVFAILIFAQYVIPDESDDIGIQKARTDWLVSKIIDFIPDDDDKMTQDEELEDLTLVDYEDFGGLEIKDGANCCDCCVEMGADCCECCKTCGWDDIVRKISMEVSPERLAMKNSNLKPLDPPTKDEEAAAGL
jgi:hypothetical protein